MGVNDRLMAMPAEVAEADIEVVEEGRQDNLMALGLAEGLITGLNSSDREIMGCQLLGIRRKCHPTVQQDSNSLQ